MTHPHPAVTLSVRISPHMRHQLEQLADSTARTKSFLAAEAMESYLITQALQVKAIKDSAEKADSKEARFVHHDKVTD